MSATANMSLDTMLGTNSGDSDLQSLDNRTVHETEIGTYKDDDRGYHYRVNVNLKVDEWLHYFIVTSAIINLAFAAFTFGFQISHPKSR